MKKKLFSAVLLLALVAAPVASHAGFFDIFRANTGYSNSAQVRSSVLAYKRGDKADIILQVQKILAEQKMYDGDLSGLIGPKTELSIKAWQKAHSLPVSGLLDAETITSILGRGPESVGGNRDGLECAGSAPQIMVTSPNSGETYQIGGQIEVTWETCNIPASELVYITIGTSANGQGHAFLTTGGTGTQNDGSEAFTVSDTLTAGQYYVSAFRPAPNYLRDFSDSSFAIGVELPTIASLQAQCNTSNGNTSGRWSRVMFPWVGDQILHPSIFTLQVVVCDVVDPSHPRTLVVFASNAGQLQTQLYRSDTSAQAQGMELEIDNSYAPLKVYNITMNTAQFPFPIGFHTMKSSLYNPDNIDLVEQTWIAPGAFEIVNQVSGGNCDGNAVGLQVLATTPSGVQTNMNDFPVLEFKVQNSSNCVVRLNGVRLAYMTTDTLPYFEDISLRDKATMTNIGPSQTLGLQSGDFINFSDDDTTPYLIPAGVTKEFVVVLEGYIPQTQGTLTYAAYANKNMIFGFPKLNPLDTDFVNPEQAFNISLTGDIWGKVVKLPPSAF